MRINAYISKCGIASRRKAEEIILESRVTVNGKVAELQTRVEEGDIVKLDGEIIESFEKEYFMFHKPADTVCSHHVLPGKISIWEKIPQEYHHLRLSGRLDEDVSGIIILTNDGELIQKLMHPSNETLKTYVLHAEKVTQKQIDRLKKGVIIEEKRVNIKVLGYKDAKLTIQIHEGRKHIVKKLAAAVGIELLKLERVAVGEYLLGDLKVGAIRKIQK